MNNSKTFETSNYNIWFFEDGDSSVGIPSWTPFTLTIEEEVAKHITDKEALKKDFEALCRKYYEPDFKSYAWSTDDDNDYQGEEY